MGKPLILKKQKRNLGQDLTIIKVHAGPIEKNVKYHNTTIIRLVIEHEQLKEKETFW